MVKDDCKQRDIGIHQATEMTQHCSVWRSLVKLHAYAPIRVATTISQKVSQSLLTTALRRSAILKIDMTSLSAVGGPIWQTGAEWRVDCGDMVEIETGSRIQNRK